MIRSLTLAILLATATSPLAAQPSAAPDYSSAIADPARPAADRERDAARKPAELLAFAGVKPGQTVGDFVLGGRSEEHTSELQSLMRTSYAVLCSTKKTHKQNFST